MCPTASAAAHNAKGYSLGVSSGLCDMAPAIGTQKVAVGGAVLNVDTRALLRTLPL